MVSFGIIVYVLYGSVKSNLQQHLAENATAVIMRISHGHRILLAIVGIILMFITHFADVTRQGTAYGLVF